MIVLLNTSTPVCQLVIIDGDKRHEYDWQADRQLAKDLLGWLTERLQETDKSWQDITGIGVFEGPGSFTGLRIGLTVMNTLADSLRVPIVGGQGDDWKKQIQDRLLQGDDDKIVLPYYHSDANITTPRK